MRRERLLPQDGEGAVGDGGDIRTAAALGDQPAARLQGLIHSREESGMIAHPVEGGGAEDDIGLLVEVQMEQVALQVGDLTGMEPFEVGAGQVEHVGRLVDCDHPAAWQA